MILGVKTYVRNFKGTFLKRKADILKVSVDGGGAVSYQRQGLKMGRIRSVTVVCTWMPGMIRAILAHCLYPEYPSNHLVDGLPSTGPQDPLQPVPAAGGLKVGAWGELGAGGRVSCCRGLRQADRNTWHLTAASYLPTQTWGKTLSRTPRGRRCQSTGWSFCTAALLRECLWQR